MEDEALTVANGAAAAGDGPAVPNGYSPERDQTREGDGKEDEGSDDTTVKVLQQEIQGLVRVRSELQAELQEARAEMERSEVEKKAIASHASYLEGELFRTQHDLTSASSVAESAESEALGLRRAVDDLKAEKASLVASKAALESQVRGLEEMMADYAALEADLAAEREKVAAAESKREGEIYALELKGKALEEQLRLSREEKEAVEAELKRSAAREAELKKSVEELKERSSELEATISGFMSKVDRDLAVNQKDKEAEVAAVKCLPVSWATAAAAAASTATVAAAVTAIYLRHARQR